MNDIEKKAEEPLTREGLTGFFAQGDLDNNGRVDWDIDTLVTLFLNTQYESEQRGRLAERRELLEMLKSVREEVWDEDSLPAIDRAIQKLEGK